MINRLSIRGNFSYGEILELQKKEFLKRVGCKKDGSPLPEDVVFFVEHLPVYTLGINGKREHVLMSADLLKEKGIEYYEIGRGGDVTYHGPGQITMYPIIDMERYRLGVKDYVWLLEETVIQTIREYGIKGGRIEGKTGVWIDINSPYERKISAIGIKCSRFVSMHGLALNVSSDLSAFGGIVPCGLTQGVTSISKELRQEINLNEVEEKLWVNFTGLLLPRILSRENS